MIQKSRYPTREERDEIALTAVRTLRNKLVIVHWDDYQAAHVDKVNRGDHVDFKTVAGRLLGTGLTPPLFGNRNSAISLLIEGSADGVTTVVPASRLISVEAF